MTPRQLKTKRQALGITQQQLADKLCYTVRQINRYETGAAEIPRIAELAINSLK